VGMKEIPAEGVIDKAAEKMKPMDEFRPPEWALFVKTGAHRQRPPQDPDWWWIRSAAVLRKISMKGGMGVSLLRKEYGGRKNKGHKPEHKYRASGAVLRKILQQLEAAGFVAKDKKSGRKVTREGIAFLSAAAKESRKVSK
jgi:small subunit ribosomal protein S19e